MALTTYAPGLYAANALAVAFLNRTVNQTNFRGLPIVGVFRGAGALQPSDEGLVALVDFAAAFNAPLVVMDDSASTQATDYLFASAQACAKLFDTAKTKQPVFVDNGISSPVVFSGPFIAVGTSDPNRTSSVAFAWTTATAYSRTSEYQPYGAGMMAVSWFTTAGNLGPPVFVVGSGVEADLLQLKKRWQGDAVTSTSQYQAVQDAAVARPGLARLCNAALVPYIVLTIPT